MKSRRKGKAGEREAAAKLREVLGADARRGAQHRGGPDSPDVDGVPGLHVEVKRCESLRMYDAMAQAVGDAGAAVPLVMHRRNNREWLAIVRVDDLKRLKKVLNGGKA